MSNEKLVSSLFDTTRMGRVIISIEAINEDPKVVYAVMSKIIPITLLISKEANIIEYLAISDHFDELKSNEMIPEYGTRIHSNGDATFVRKTFKRQIPDSVKDEIMRTILKNKVDLDKFKEFVLRFNKTATDEDFETYDESFLEALLIYIDRNKKK